MSNRKEKKVYKFLGIALICFLVFAFTPLSKPFFALGNKLGKIDLETYENNRHYLAIVWLICATFFARICYVMAKKRGKDPATWAKRGFLFQIWAVAYLYFIENED